MLLSIMLLLKSKDLIYVEFMPTGETKNFTAYLENVIICYNKKKGYCNKMVFIKHNYYGLKDMHKGTLPCEVY